MDSSSVKRSWFCLITGNGRIDFDFIRDWHTLRFSGWMIRPFLMHGILERWNMHQRRYSVFRRHVRNGPRGLMTYEAVVYRTHTVRAHMQMRRKNCLVHGIRYTMFAIFSRLGDFQHEDLKIDIRECYFYFNWYGHHIFILAS